MSAVQTWRVGLTDGSVAEVDTVVRVEASVWRASWRERGAHGLSAHDAVQRLSCVAFPGAVVEILAPGVPSRAELIAERDRAVAGLDAAMAGSQRLVAEAAELRSERAELTAQRDAAVAQLNRADAANELTEHYRRTLAEIADEFGMRDATTSALAPAATRLRAQRDAWRGIAMGGTPSPAALDLIGRAEYARCVALRCERVDAVLTPAIAAQRDAVATAWREGAEAMREACVDAALTALSRDDCDVVTPVRECSIPTRPEGQR